MLTAPFIEPRYRRSGLRRTIAQPSFHSSSRHVPRALVPSVLGPFCLGRLCTGVEAVQAAITGGSPELAIEYLAKQVARHATAYFRKIEEGTRSVTLRRYSCV